MDNDEVGIMESKKTNKYLGSSAESWLEEEGILEEVDAVVEKEVFVFLLEKEMKEQQLNIPKLAKKMGTSYSAAKRVLNPRAPSTLDSLRRAAHAVGKSLTLGLA